MSLDLHRSVTYLFRTTGQVLGVSLSGALLQAVLNVKLQQRIKGADAEKVSILTSEPSLMNNNTPIDHLHDKVCCSDRKETMY